MTTRVEDDRLDSPAASPLVEALGAELLERYGVPDADPDHLTADDLAPPSGAFVVARVGTAAVGCGGLRRYDTAIGELKRMYVAPPFRAQGVARLVLSALEDRARQLGYERLVLETGGRQPEAIGLYTSAGYRGIERYGAYRSSPQSRCYAKWL
jgi:GNAT superfamily N-acetyltransferase